MEMLSSQFMCAFFSIAINNILLIIGQHINTKGFRYFKRGNTFELFYIPHYTNG